MYWLSEYGGGEGRPTGVTRSGSYHAPPAPSADWKERGSGSQISDVKELSGGERSVTTMSLLMALWKSIESPFRILDEFDVYMDQVGGPSPRASKQGRRSAGEGGPL